MFRTAHYKDIENTLDRYILIDVRSPEEYAESTITGAVNIPLFRGDERAHVGTAYKQQGKAAAVKLGIGYVSQSLPFLYDSFAKLHTRQKKFLLFCSRGGMRSESIGSLLSSIGFPVMKLHNGYKGYRQHIVSALPERIALTSTVTLYGKTGTGKTHILHELKQMGFDILDLEACAGHRGSALGALGLPPPPSQKQFETLIYDALKKAKSPLLFMEGESKRIGNVYIPNSLAEKMKQGRKLLIEADLQTRKEIIQSDYLSAGFDKAASISAINSLARYIGNDRIKQYTSLIQNGQYDRVIEELMIKYYDIVYNTSREAYEQTFLNISPRRTAAEIIAYMGISAPA